MENILHHVSLVGWGLVFFIVSLTFGFLGLVTSSYVREKELKGFGLKDCLSYGKGYLDEFAAAQKKDNLTGLVTILVLGHFGCILFFLFLLGPRKK